MHWNWSILVSAFVLSLLAGTEISLITAGSSTERGWGKAWLATGAGLVSMIPIAAILYFIFVHLPGDRVEYIGGVLVFLLGLYFAIKGFRKRGKPESKEDGHGLSTGLLAAYVAVVVEGLEITTVTTALGAAAGGAFFSAWIGEAAGIGLMLAALSSSRRWLARIPGWAFQLIVGVLMMAVSAFLIARAVTA